MLKKLWNDEAGVIVSAEIVMVGTILVIGSITGLSSLRDGVIEELADLGAALGSVDQSFTIGGVVAHSSATGGSRFFDRPDFCESGDNMKPATNSRCLLINDGCFMGAVGGNDFDNGQHHH
jgi:hypothetical protein